MTTDDLTRRAVIAAHDAECIHGYDACRVWSHPRGPLSEREQAIVEAWRADREDYQGRYETAHESFLASERDRDVSEAAIQRVRDLHRAHRIYDECDHRHDYLDDNGSLPDGVVEIYEIGLTCQDGYLYSACYECCTDDDGFATTEECVDKHGHKRDEAHHCRTVAALDEVASS